MRFAQILSLVVFTSAVEINQKWCGCAQPAPCCNQKGGLPAKNFKIKCCDTASSDDFSGYGSGYGRGGRGTGLISSKSKGQALNAAKANNKFEELVERLDGNFADKEVEKGSIHSNSVQCGKTFMKINGHYKAVQDIKKKSAAKEAESGKAANCFRKESKSHLMVIRSPYGSAAYEPLEQRELVDCDCTTRPLSTRADNCACYCK